MQPPRTFLLATSLALAGCGTPAAPATPAPIPAPTAAAKGAADPAPDCQVEVEGPASAAVGEASQARVTLRPTGAFEVNQEAPMEVAVRSDGLSTSKASYGVDDASVLAPREIQMSVPFTPTHSGEQTLEVKAHFGLCDGQACALCRKKAHLRTVVN